MTSDYWECPNCGHQMGLTGHVDVHDTSDWSPCGGPCFTLWEEYNLVVVGDAQ